MQSNERTDGFPFCTLQVGRPPPSGEIGHELIRMASSQVQTSKSPDAMGHIATIFPLFLPSCRISSARLAKLSPLSRATPEVAPAQSRPHHSSQQLPMRQGGCKWREDTFFFLGHLFPFFFSSSFFSGPFVSNFPCSILQCSRFHNNNNNNKKKLVSRGRFRTRSLQSLVRALACSSVQDICCQASVRHLGLKTLLGGGKSRVVVRCKRDPRNATGQ